MIQIVSIHLNGQCRSRVTGHLPLKPDCGYFRHKKSSVPVLTDWYSLPGLLALENPGIVCWRHQKKNTAAVPYFNRYYTVFTPSRAFCSIWICCNEMGRTTSLESIRSWIASPWDLIAASSSRSSTTLNLQPSYRCTTASQAWITDGSMVNFLVPLQIIMASRISRNAWYLKSAASPFRPFQISIVSSCDILMAAAAAAWNIAPISIELSLGVSTCEVSTSEIRFGHSQEGSISKKWLASTIKDAARCSSFRLASAIIRLTAGAGLRMLSHLAKSSPRWNRCIIVGYCWLKFSKTTSLLRLLLKRRIDSKRYR